MSRSLLGRRILAIIAAFAMIMVICGFTARGFSAHGPDQDHCDWTMHFTGLSGSAPKPAPIARPVLAAWAPAVPDTETPRSLRRPRANPARGPPDQPRPASSAA